MDLIKYLKEFLYGVAAVSVVFSSAVIALTIFMFPFIFSAIVEYETGMTWFAMALILPSYACMYVIARHFNLIEAPTRF